MKVSPQLAATTAQPFDAIKDGFALVQLRLDFFGIFERRAAGPRAFKPCLGVRQRTARRVPRRCSHCLQFLQPGRNRRSSVEMLLGCDDARIIRLEAETEILRMVGEPLHRIRRLDPRHARLADILARRNERVRIGGALAQQPQLVRQRQAAAIQSDRTAAGSSCQRKMAAGLLVRVRMSRWYASIRGSMLLSTVELPVVGHGARSIAMMIERIKSQRLGHE